jgi:hypothetical protein
MGNKIRAIVIFIQHGNANIFRSHLAAARPLYVDTAGGSGVGVGVAGGRVAMAVQMIGVLDGDPGGVKVAVIVADPSGFSTNVITVGGGKGKPGAGVPGVGLVHPVRLSPTARHNTAMMIMLSHLLRFFLQPNTSPISAPLGLPPLEYTDCSGPALYCG